MTEKTVAQADLEMDALSLMDFLNETVGEDESIVACYVTDDAGRVFNHVKLVLNTENDGTETVNLVLS